MEAYILELVLWLHHLARKSKTVTSSGDGGMKLSIKSPISAPLHKSGQQTKHESLNAPLLTVEDQKMLQDVSKKKWKPGRSKSQDFDSEQTRLRKYDRLSKSSSHSPTRGKKGSVIVKRLPSAVPIVAFGIDKENALDVIDRVDVLR